MHYSITLGLLLCGIIVGHAKQVLVQQTGPLVGANGIFPSLAATAVSGPVRSECGIGALMPWADRLYMISYLSVPNAGNGTGLYEIDQDLNIKKVADHQSVYANRMLHPPTNSIIIGPYVIDSQRNIRVFSALLSVRIGAMAEHLTDSNKVYFVSMDGPLFEADVVTLEVKQIFDLVKELDIPASAGEQPHFKCAHTMNGRLVVGSNTFEEADQLGTQAGGRLAEWTGGNNSWKILERTAFYEVTGRHNFGKVIYATGWDAMSAILLVMDGGDSSAPSTNTTWRRYRLPKASHAFDHLWQTEWPRIREVETERYLMDLHGMFYELSPLGWAASTWGVRPVSQHLRVVPDFASFRGFLVLGGNQVSSIMDNNLITGQSQSGLWFGKSDDLWSFGKPQGWGAVWLNTAVQLGSVSDPFLMTGFDKKVLHIYFNRKSPNSAIIVAIDVDFLGNAHDEVSPFYSPWAEMQSISLQTNAASYAYYAFPVGFSAHWVRLRVSYLICDSGCGTVTAQFHYT